MTPAAGLKAIIVAAGLTELTGFTLKVSKLVDDAADTVAAFIDHPGSPPETVVGMNYPSVQVFVRAAKGSGAYEAGYTAIDAIVRKLHLVDPVSVTAQYSELVSCLASTGIAPLGDDSKGRPTFSVNFRLITQPADPGNRM